MNNDELRALVRQIVADKLRERAGTAVGAPGPPVIEPDVPCTHCNYCKSHGY